MDKNDKFATKIVDLKPGDVIVSMQYVKVGNNRVYVHGGIVHHIEIVQLPDSTPGDGEFRSGGSGESEDGGDNMQRENVDIYMMGHQITPKIPGECQILIYGREHVEWVGDGKLSHGRESGYR